MLLFFSFAQLDCFDILLLLVLNTEFRVRTDIVRCVNAARLGVSSPFLFAGELASSRCKCVSFSSHSHTPHTHSYIWNGRNFADSVCRVVAGVCGMESEAAPRQARHSQPQRDRKLCGYVWKLKAQIKEGLTDKRIQVLMGIIRFIMVPSMTVV